MCTVLALHACSLYFPQHPLFFPLVLVSIILSYLPRTLLVYFRSLSHPWSCFSFTVINMLFFKLLAFAALVAAAPEAVIDRRTAHSKSCNRDNLLRALVDSRYSSSASIFCSSFLSLPAASTTTTTQTIRTAPPVVTSTVVVPSTTTYDLSRPLLLSLQPLSSIRRR